MMKFCIVEDAADTAQTIKAYIERFAQTFEFEAQTAIFDAADDFLENYPDDCDIVFMDIDLPRLNGMEAARKLREKDARVVVIFVTNLAQYAVDGYGVGAFDFIVKPATYPNFALKLRRALKHIRHERGKELWCVTRSGKKLLEVSEIKYIEVMKHVITYHTVGGDIVGSGTLKSVSESLEGLPFSLCNRCYLVNLKYVTEINGHSVTVGGDELQISIPRRKKFLNSFNDYLGEGGSVE